jgi:hypothetical protein
MASGSTKVTGKEIVAALNMITAGTTTTIATPTAAVIVITMIMTADVAS